MGTLKKLFIILVMVITGCAFPPTKRVRLGNELQDAYAQQLKHNLQQCANELTELQSTSDEIAYTQQFKKELAEFQIFIEKWSVDFSSQIEAHNVMVEETLINELTFIDDFDKAIVVFLVKSNDVTVKIITAFNKNSADDWEHMPIVYFPPEYGGNNDDQEL